VSEDLVGTLVSQPVDESARRFRAEPLALPVGSKDPRDVGPPAAVALSKSCLHRAHGLGICAATGNPVEPDLVGPPRAGNEPLVMGSQLVWRCGATAGEFV
jgi:hypothetical protein